ncbi:type VI secretion system membrane subunit TssM [Parasulfuritortus cantonensis]|uniref:Type VI secretion system membrane subunit TssM n=1 Tax=Parasulfuritortus cantonensis TaxID=2528202 RepID=A0A4V6NB53_9PROT|nr:type VI secretion system membrane subunit TssM [Parasulfuritortus cantonensis]
MKEKLRNVFTNHWVLAGLGLLLLSLVIWFVGPAFAFYNHRPLGSATSRIVLILLVILIWAAYEGWKVYRDWRANKQMLAALAEGESQDQNLSAREVADLKQRFEQAVSTLKKARFENKAGGGRSYLYQLPWYVFIGAPGSGKTTALINSGLRFPLADKFGKDAIKGVGGTRNCDWWFTDEAVLLDTAGRYTTQSSNQTVDSRAWQGFLKLIRKFRPRQPLNGAIITLSISDLLTQNAAERQEYGRAVHQRIQELYGELGCRFPIYIMVTKCDLLAGFMEFYGDLGREDRAQVWGTTFEYRAEGGGTSPWPSSTRNSTASRNACTAACSRSSKPSAIPSGAPSCTPSRSSSATSSRSSTTSCRRCSATRPSRNRACCAASTSPAAPRKAARSTACWAPCRAPSASSARSCRRPPVPARAISSPASCARSPSRNPT